ncbi:MAG: site-2 protease family protein [bacterium]|nr:site-2 protease family protein [bacterium]
MRLSSVEPRSTTWERAVPGPAAAVTAVARRGRFPYLHLVLLVVTALTTTVAGALWNGAPLEASLRLLLAGLPFSATLLAILFAHEMGHYLLCRRYGVDASLPYFLPAPPLVFIWGTIGAFIRIRSPFPDRRALFDIGAGGPWAGFVPAVAATAWGLAHSTIAPAPIESGMIEFGDSLLTHWLVWMVLDVESSRVVLHPVAFAGWTGLLVTSLNLLPVGQLDGGHVLHAVFRGRLRVISVLLIGFLVWLGLTRAEWLVWAAILTSLLMLGHPPPLDDDRPLGTARTLGAVASLLLFVVTFVPEPIRLLP